MNDHSNGFDKIIDHLMALRPLLFRNLMHSHRIKSGIPPACFSIMFLLGRREKASMSEIGQILHIPKPNVTPLVDKLIDLELAERKSSTTDRRKVYVTLSAKGKKFKREREKKIKNQIIKKLSVLSDEDTTDLVHALQEVRRILGKIENRKSKIENRKSRIENRESKIENRESKIENRESRIENRK